MSCSVLILVYMIGSAALGFLLAWMLKPATIHEVKNIPKGSSPNTNNKNTADELDKLQKKYENLYDSKLDVDTALMAAESTLDGLKMDYERLERDMSTHNNRHNELQKSFDNYKDKKEGEISELRSKAKKAIDNYETVKFQLAKSNRINEKLQESLTQLKSENEKLSSELVEANEEMEVVNASMNELKADYDDLKDKTKTYNDKINDWQNKYQNLNISFETLSSEKQEISENYENYQSSTADEIEKLTEHLSSLQSQLEESVGYANEYADAYTSSEDEKKKLNNELEIQKKQAAEELLQIQNQIKELENDYEAVQKRESLLDDRFSNLQDKHLDLELAFNNTVEEKNNLEIAYKEYKKSTKEQLEKLETDAQTWVDKLESSNLELAQYKDIAEELERNKQQLTEELEKIRDNHDKEASVSDDEYVALNETFDDLKSKYFEINKELSATKIEKERINFEHENYQEQIKIELDLLRKENKNLSKSLAELKAEKRMLEYSKIELEDRVAELEANQFSTSSGGENQQKLIKMIGRLRINVEKQDSLIKSYADEKIQYEQRIEALEKELSLLGQPQKNIKPNNDAKIDSDDLKVLDGINSLTEEILNDFGIYNFTQLCNISDDNKELLIQVLGCDIKDLQKWEKQAKSKIKKINIANKK